jgi:predicted metal-dependent phosphoesterase TrpH
MVSSPVPTEYRGIIHFHSRYSPDSLTRLGTIVKTAERLSLDFVILTDHDTIRGSQELARYAASRRLRLEVPLAAEYHTDHGDLIAVFIEKEIVSRKLDEFVAEVRSQGGLILLPHPYVNHKNVEALAEHADRIEVFNGRAAPCANAAAQELAERYQKPGYWSSDAHLAINLPRVVTALEMRGTLKESLRSGNGRAIECAASGGVDTVLSLLIKLAKQCDIVGFMRLPWRIFRRMTRRSKDTL